MATSFGSLIRVTVWNWSAYGGCRSQDGPGWTCGVHHVKTEEAVFTGQQLRRECKLVAPPDHAAWNGVCTRPHHVQICKCADRRVIWSLKCISLNFGPKMPFSFLEIIDLSAVMVSSLKTTFLMIPFLLHFTLHKLKQFKQYTNQNSNFAHFTN